MDCPACIKRGKVWNGDDPKCAFTTGVFSPDNWMCATMNELRAKYDEDTKHNPDTEQNAVLIAGEECDHVVLSWYKRRGRVEGAHMITEGVATPLTLEEAQRILK